MGLFDKVKKDITGGGKRAGGIIGGIARGDEEAFKEGEMMKLENLLETSRYEPSAGPQIALAEDYLRKEERKKRKRREEKEKAAEKERLRPKVKSTEGILDYEKLTKLTKQMQATTGQAISPDILQGIVKGTIEAQIEPARAREERAMDRAIQQKRLNIEQKQHEEALEVEEEAAEMGFAGDILEVVGAVTVLCTELHRQGLLDMDVIHQANKYRREHVDIEIYHGYLIWATPLAEMMKKSVIVTKIVSSFWKPLTYELASRVTGEKGNIIGKITYKILAPFSKLVYRFKEVKQWETV